MPGELLPSMTGVAPGSKSKRTLVNPDMSLYLIVSHKSAEVDSQITKTKKSADDLVYEQDILRDPASIKPWLGYIDYKHQHGTLLEQAYVSVLISYQEYQISCQL